MITADYQLGGRGQRTRHWESERGKNLLASTIFYPAFLPVHQQFYLNMAVSLAVRGLVQEQVPEYQVQIKWPNDIYLGGKKVAGVLVENALSGNALQSAVVGIGININQQQFLELPLATSFYKASGQERNVSVVRGRLALWLEHYYYELQAQRFQKLKHQYCHYLLGWQRRRAFSHGESSFEAVVAGINEHGQLLLLQRGHLRAWNHGELTWVL